MSATPPVDPPILDDDTIARLLRLRASVPAAGEDVLLELVRLFQTDSSARVAALTEAIAASDGDRVRLIAHSLKGAAANLGANRVVVAAMALESGTGPRTPEAIAALGRAVDEAAVALRQRFT